MPFAFSFTGFGNGFCVAGACCLNGLANRFSGGVLAASACAFLAATTRRTITSNHHDQLATFP